ncbi:MAG: permease [Pseudomonadota bacterium]
MNATDSIGWFARHELRLAWRDWAALMSGGHKLRDSAIVLCMVVFALGLHGLAYALIAPKFSGGASIDVGLLVMISAAVLLSFTMMLSQALESVTRAFYARDDLDLILSSPSSSAHLFAVRIVLMAGTTALMSGLMVAPFIHVAAILAGPAWLSAYGVLLAASMVATGLAVFITLALFKWVGAKRTRLVAQITAAVVGASFLIGLQVIAIISYGSMSRFSLLGSDGLLGNAPSMNSMLWWPAFAATGAPAALAGVMFVAVLFFGIAVIVGASQFRHIVVAALGVSDTQAGAATPRRAFKARTTHGALLHKEWMLLARDPWLISQTLMQILYLVPPALLLWVKYGQDLQIATILAPVVVMAVGQLAGGLAWLTISGEDAPDLVATAPVPTHALLWAKVKAVLAIVLTVAAPLVIALSFLSLWGAAVTLVGVAVASSCAILIQLWFRAQATRRNFRRRHVASRASTFCEAFASILCAATAGLAAAASWAAVAPAVLVAMVMAVAWTISPRQRSGI